MASPSPHPYEFNYLDWLSFILEYGLNNLFIFSFLIPIPVSIIDIYINRFYFILISFSEVIFKGSAFKIIFPPLFVNFIELPLNLLKILYLLNKLFIIY